MGENLYFTLNFIDTYAGLSLFTALTNYTANDVIRLRKKLSKFLSFPYDFLICIINYLTGLLLKKKF